MHPKLIVAAALVALAVCLTPPAAWATCTEICDLEVLAPTGCQRAGDVIDTGPLRVVAYTGSMCCAPPMEPDGDGSCSLDTSAAAPTLVGPTMGGAWQLDGACGDQPVQRWSGALVSGTYRLDLPGCELVELIEVDVATTDADGCRVAPGRRSSPGLWLLAFGLLAVRRVGSQDRRAR